MFSANIDAEHIVLNIKVRATGTHKLKALTKFQLVHVLVYFQCSVDKHKDRVLRTLLHVHRNHLMLHSLKWELLQFHHDGLVQPASGFAFNKQV